MTIDVTALRERLEAAADAASLVGAQQMSRGHQIDFAYESGRESAFRRALELLDQFEDEAATERDEALSGEGVDLAAVARLESFAAGYGDYATETGALDQASGMVYSDADTGL